MQDKETNVPEDVSAREARRAFLKKAGRFAIYTPPAMMVLMQPGRKAIAQSGGEAPAPKAVDSGSSRKSGLNDMLQKNLL